MASSVVVAKVAEVDSTYLVVVIVAKAGRMVVVAQGSPFCYYDSARILHLGGNEEYTRGYHSKRKKATNRQ